MLLSTTPFKRGSTFTFLVELPSSVTDGQFTGWTLKSQMRRQGNSTPEGLISTLTATWEDPAIAKVIRLHDAVTADWPIGVAEVDVLLTSPTGEKISSDTLYFDIMRGIPE